ncbi:hypothetical protein ACIBO2_41725 [Nonomuraea sp. NPDC050022]|uniref:hypothetical protein n=1 Tax=unclassified Nonomuraea TaxID=2593643 RepID=UPI0033C87F40
MIPPDDLDPTDESILDEIRKMFSVLDPVPETLVERVQFARESHESRCPRRSRESRG